MDIREFIDIIVSISNNIFSNIIDKITSSLNSVDKSNMLEKVSHSLKFISNFNPIFRNQMNFPGTIYISQAKCQQQMIKWDFIN